MGSNQARAKINQEAKGRKLMSCRPKATLNNKG